MRAYSARASYDNANSANANMLKPIKRSQTFSWRWCCNMSSFFFGCFLQFLSMSIVESPPN